MNEILIAAGFGSIGALVRFLVTSLKVMHEKIEIGKLLVYAVIILAIGAFSGIVLSYGKILSFLAGYAGLDLLDGYYKSFMKKKIVFK